MIALIICLVSIVLGLIFPPIAAGLGIGLFILAAISLVSHHD